MPQLVKAKKSSHSKTIMIHQPGSPRPPDDFVLFPQDVIREKHSSIRDDRPRRPKATESAKGSSSSRPPPHVTESKATTPSRREAHKPSRRPICLDHMSPVNCTVDCSNGKSLAHQRMPPKAPSPPRLPTPDLSDIGEDDLWSCCGSSWSVLSKESSRSTHETDSMWDDMEEKVRKAKAWQSKTSSDSRKAALKRDR